MKMQTEETKMPVKRAGSKTRKSLEDLLKDGLKDIYSAEKQLVEALPYIAKACDSEDLQDAIRDHWEQTKRHATRVEKILARMNVGISREEKCEAITGHIRETKKIIDEYEPGPVKDSALIIAAQKMEHYEIAAYGSLCELCDVLGYDRFLEILGRTLDEEKDADDVLGDLAEDVNDEAFAMGENQTEEEIEKEGSDRFSML